MSKYTTEVRFICESQAGFLEQQGYNSIKDVIALARPKIFDFDYPIYDEAYRETLESKILLHYYTREICAETYGRWKLFLQSRLLEIMPYYNQLYESALMKYDIFEDVNYTRSGNRNIDEDGTSKNKEVTDTDTTDKTNTTSKTVIDTDTTDKANTTSRTVTDTDTTNTGTNEVTTTTNTTNTDTGLAWDMYSDTPQGTVGNVDNNTYLTNARKNTSNTTGESEITEVVSGSTSDIGTVDTTENTTGETTGVGTVDTTENATGETTGVGTVDTTRTNDGSHTKDVLETYTELIKGKMSGKSYMEMIKEFRDTFLNIDMMIINDLSDLFMMIY